MKGSRSTRMGERRETVRIAATRLALACVLLAASPAAATDLLTGKSASYADRPGTAADKASVVFVKAPPLEVTPPDPRCSSGAVSLVRLADDDQVVELTLPCAGWSAKGEGYLFKDPAGASGVSVVVLQRGKLAIKAKGDAYGAAALAGPTTFVQAELFVGTRSYCGRFRSPDATSKANREDAVAWKGASSACAPVDIACPALPPVGGPGACDVEAGDTAVVWRGDVLVPGAIYRGGSVRVDAGGTIDCVGCDCTDGTETVVTCGQASISPGLLNAHDHLTFSHNAPLADSGERFEQRHDWRLGLRGHGVLSATGGAGTDALRWGELRFVVGGATSTAGAGGTLGLARNLDGAASDEGLGQMPALLQTFPLGDASGPQLDASCAYPAITTPASVAGRDSYVPHVAEGIDAEARNEFRCTSMSIGGARDLLAPRSALVHAIGLTAEDYAAMAARRAKLVWSPRSNLRLYGDTARVTTAARLGVELALGSDWTPSGSMNLLRELRCAADFDQDYIGEFFDDEDLWRMVTVSAARALAVDDAVGTLTAGLAADIAVFDASTHDGFAAVVEATPADVVAVLRAGVPLYGDADLLAALPSSPACDALDVCGRAKAVCLMDDLGIGLAALEAANPGAYPLFACGEPAGEPTCVPSRPMSVDASSVYDGTPAPGDLDADGVSDDVDLCPGLFDPIRPLDAGAAPDSDGDGIGDACDLCPLSKKC